ncbi:HAMP domain-containing histidine kinase [Stappia sp. BW2]|uniref:sensor histidine kinase n=1 Tax=Stappia sp. BW2 TaxID=2592622 RepID=UPI0011DEE042|nr:HAMP domain-containing sensor histidine kinase [Stappia sp. BW2]TYC78538.1 HAMP domain-containing histidine kinase [Stappia sp. BW2]
MPFGAKRLNLARRYLWGAVVAALIPLVLIATLYDRYSANLIDNLVTNRVNAHLEGAAVQMSNFMAVQVNKLESIVDLPDTTDFFLEPDSNSISPLMRDFLLLEVESPDVYAIELSRVSGETVATVPRNRAREEPADLTTLPLVQHGVVEVLGPVLPENGRPGWFLIRMPVLFNQKQIGMVSLRMRLASLTELAAQLVEPGVYQPQIVVFDRERLTPVGTRAEEADILARSRQFLPGWRIQLVDGGGDLEEPRNRIRYILLIAAIVSALGLVVLFFMMSQKLTGYLLPLNEGAQAIANGNFGVSVSEDGPGELGSLARSYNRMREQLENLITSRVEVERRAALGGMAAGIAHEIRNPLATVVTTVHGLKRNEQDAERQKMFEVISSEITRVDKTIGEFLNYAKPSPPVREPVLIREAFRTIRTLLATTAHEKNIVIDLSGESSLQIEMDRAHFSQILLNLTLNGIDAMPDGGHLQLRAYRDDGKVVVSVADDGTGMDAETRSKVLRPFFTTRGKGSGLGLPVTKQLVETNGGQMFIESEAGHGTTVILVFPKHDAAQERPA